MTSIAFMFLHIFTSGHIWVYMAPCPARRIHRGQRYQFRRWALHRTLQFEMTTSECVIWYCLEVHVAPQFHTVGLSAMEEQLYKGGLTFGMVNDLWPDTWCKGHWEPPESSLTTDQVQTRRKKTNGGSTRQVPTISGALQPHAHLFWNKSPKIDIH